MDYDDFVKVHGLLLTAAGLPESLYRQLYDKIMSETFDGGNYFLIEPCEEGRQRRLVLTSDFMAKESNVFLIDHAWTFRLSDAPSMLRQVPGLAERMAALMCVDADLTEETTDEVDENGKTPSVDEILDDELRNAKERDDASMTWLELEELGIDDEMFPSLDLPNKFPNLVALSLYGNKIKNLDTIMEGVSRCRNLRGLWLNDNPVAQKCEGPMLDKILHAFPKLEILNSRFTFNYGEWALGFCGGIYGKDNPGSGSQSEHPLQSVTSLNLANRGIQNLIHKAFSPAEMPFLSHLNLRENPLEENSSDELIGILKTFPYLNSLEVDIPGALGESALEILESLPNLSLLNGVKASKIFETGKQVVDSMLQPRLPEWNHEDSLADRVLNAMWLYLMTYRLADEEKIDETSVWYVMDELGSALQHSDEPNFRVSPFLYMPDGNLSSGLSFSILWPTHHVQKGDACTRDFLCGIGEDKQRSARLTAWFHTPKNYFIRAFEKRLQQLQSKSLTSFPSGHPKTSSLLRGDGEALRVYTDIPYVQEFLTRPEFSITNEPKEADIIWTSMQVDEETKKAVGITDEQYINQFPSETCLVMKHNLAETVQKAYGTPEWLQPTYNLEKNLTELIGDYHVREREGADNLWIMKPWNMARTIDTTITSNLSAIIRTMETGPKICQKYIENPALFRGKKFDLRYIVLVRSINPSEIFLSDVFWVRMANNAYSLEKRSLFEYETHFTVMNYRGRMNHINTPDFIREFEREHQVKWLDIDQRIRNMIRSVFEAAALVHPGMHSPKARAIYGIDVMLDSHFCPKLLEVTYCPDCTRACNYDTESLFGEEVKGSDFFNNVFGVLFLNETNFVTPL